MMTDTEYTAVLVAERAEHTAGRDCGRASCPQHRREVRYRIVNRGDEHYYASFAEANEAWERFVTRAELHSDVDARFEQEWPTASGQWVGMASVVSSS